MDPTEAIAGSHVDWANQTIIHPLGFALVVVAGLTMIVVPRRYAIWPMLAIACFVAPAQRVTVAELDFSLLRILVLFGWMRLFAHGELRGFAWRPLDTVLVAWAAVSTAAYTVQIGTLAALTNRLGASFDAVGTYFLVRCLVRSWDDVRHAVRASIVLSVPVLAAFLVEASTGRNLFAFFGGLPEFTVERDGRLRCQGAFSHSIMAGCFWAAAMPLIAAHWWGERRDRPPMLVGLLACGVIVFLTASSTPVMSVIFAILGAALFGLRWRMRQLRWALVITLFGLHMVMNAPVWHLVARINIVSGNTGWHRYHLIDQAINRFDEWWLYGTPTTAHWGWGLADVTNQFVLEGVRAGFAGLGLFVAAIVIAFRNVGMLWRAVQHDRLRTATAWALGVTLFVHCMNFMAVSYFGQIIVVWYLLLGIIGNAHELAAASPRPLPHGNRHPVLTSQYAFSHRSL